MDKMCLVLVSEIGSIVTRVILVCYISGTIG